MKKNAKSALYVSLIVLVGVPLLFFIVSLATGHWNYLLWSIPPSFTAGAASLIITINQLKKDGKRA